MKVLRRFRVLLCCALLLAGAAVLADLTATAQTTQSTPYTFRIYEDLVQLPTLVLTSAGRPYSSLATDQFTLRVDGGPKFHPRNSRPEGDDPIELVFLFDLSDAHTRKVAGALKDAMAQAASMGLTSRDHISVSAFDCKLVRSHDLRPYTPEVLRQEVYAVLASPDLPPHNTALGSCPLRHRLWDATAATLKLMEPLPERRVMYLFTNGTDEASATSWPLLTQIAGSRSTTIVGFQTDAEHPQLTQAMHAYAMHLDNREDILQLLCAGTGGLVLAAAPNNAVQRMAQATDLLRSRYILEFARPRNSTAGVHDISATVGKHSLEVRPGAISFPLLDPALRNGPNVLASDPARAPEQGSRRALPKPE